SEQRDQEGDRGQRLLAARQEGDLLQPLARGLRHDFDARLEHVLFVLQEAQLGLAAPEQRREADLEVSLDRAERLPEAIAGLAIDGPYRLAQGGNRLLQIGLLRGEEGEALLEIR